MNIAFCTNRLGLVGLGATLSSLIKNCSEPSMLNLWFLCAGMTENEKSQIINLLKVESFSGTQRFIDFDPKLYFGSFPALHGDWTAYGRLLLADLINENQVLYLDSDLLVEEDVLKVSSFDFDGHLLAAVGGGRYKYTLGHKFYINKMGLPPEAEYFNSGVLLLNLHEWRENNVKDKCVKIAKQYSMELPSHDQSLLNIICAGNFAKLPKSFNCEWLPFKSKPNTSANMILHFVGSPKPWDPFSYLMHNGYEDWMKYTNREWLSYFNSLDLQSLLRVWNIRRSYLRCIMNKLNSNYLNIRHKLK